MQFYDVIKSRVSIKDYKNTPINKDKLARIVNAAMMSPSWRNNTSYSFILVDDQGEKDKLSNTIVNETNEASTSVRNAPMVAVVVADPSQSGTVGDREYYLVDSAIAMEHFVLAATNEGYGTCWIASFDEDRVRDILSIPKQFRVVAMTPVGESTHQVEHHSKKDVRDHVFINSWQKVYTENDSRFIQ